MNRLSIITVNLNDAVGLRKTLSSVLDRQTFMDIEYIVIDGGSKDGSVDVIKEYEDKISYWVSEPDRGIYNAMNKGIKRATGEYLLFLNSGDWLVDDVLAMVFAGPFTEDVVYADLLLYCEDGKTVEQVYSDRLSLSELIGTSLGHPSSFIRRELFDGNLYREDYRIISDWVFWMEELVFKRRSWRHLNIFTTYFNMYGVSSGSGVADLIRAEREDYINCSHSCMSELIRDISQAKERGVLDIMSKRKVEALADSEWLQRQLGRYVGLLFAVKKLFKIKN